MTGPHLLAAVAYDEYYNDLPRMMSDLGKLLHQNFRRLVEAGCRHIQIDEPYFTVADDQEVRAAVDAINLAIEGIPDDVHVLVHICQGNYAVGPDYDGQIGHRYFDIGRYKADIVTNIECDGFLIEHDMTHHYEGLLGNRQLGVGAVDVQDPNVETGTWSPIASRPTRGCRPSRRSSPARAASTTCRDMSHSGSFGPCGRPRPFSSGLLVSWAGNVNETQNSGSRVTEILQLTEEQLRLAETIAGIGVFELDLASGHWATTPHVAVLFGIDPHSAKQSLAAWEQTIFIDDRLKLRAAIAAAKQGGGTFGTEFRVKHPDGSVHWLTAKGETARDSSGTIRWLRGTCLDITERKTLEVRLLALSETLEARVRTRTQELDASYAQLRESERRFRLLVEECDGLRDLHARSQGDRRQLESGRRTPQGLFQSGDPRTTLLAVLFRRGQADRSARSDPGPGKSQREVRRRRLAGQKGWQSVLGERRLACNPG